ncbi:MAG: ribonuclease D [Rhodospirillaceae bacterium]|nr:ribonuclease D [Rhodospirillaceae bacterium]
MKPITDTKHLRDACESLSKADYVAIDTEFMREKTYYPILCLVQLAIPGEQYAVDPMADGIDLTPLFDLMANENILKVFHAARQDVEIFLHLSGSIPTPLFDTQIAAMVCGFGESVGYETLVNKLTGNQLDKTSRFTDWSHRPLTDRQLDYAISDVTHLRTIYEHLRDTLESSGRASWLGEEFAILTTPTTYRVEPEEAWRRVKVRSAKPKFLAVLKSIAAYRENEAQRRDVPRNRILRDDAIMDIAGQAPSSEKELARIRTFNANNAAGRLGREVLEAVKLGTEMRPEDMPKLPPTKDLPRGRMPLVELLKVLLKLKSEEHQVAQKLIANGTDLEEVAASDDADVPALKGWRREVFGADALDLKHGRIAIGANGSALKLINLS